MVTMLTAVVVIFVVTVSNVVLLLPFGIAFFAFDDGNAGVGHQRVIQMAKYLNLCKSS